MTARLDVSRIMILHDTDNIIYIYLSIMITFSGNDARPQEHEEDFTASGTNVHFPILVLYDVHVVWLKHNTVCD